MQFTVDDNDARVTVTPLTAKQIMDSRNTNKKEVKNRAVAEAFERIRELFASRAKLIRGLVGGAKVLDKIRYAMTSLPLQLMPGEVSLEFAEV